MSRGDWLSKAPNQYVSSEYLRNPRIFLSKISARLSRRNTYRTLPLLPYHARCTLRCLKNLKLDSRKHDARS